MTRNPDADRLVRTLCVCGGIAGFTAVALGAFGAHALKARLGTDLQAVFETGVRYQMYHALALFVAAWSADRWGGRWFAVAGGLFVTGMLLFSGSLYLLALGGARGLGMITPLGGLALLAGWACIAFGAWRARAA